MLRSSSRNKAAQAFASLSLGLLIGFAPTTASANHEYSDGGVVTSSPARIITFSGIDVSQDAYSIFSGSLVALSGGFDKDGFVLRTLGVYSDFDYDTGVPPVSIDGDDRFFDVMIGYQFTRGMITATAYVGFEYRDIELSPFDPGNDVEGSEAGFKVAFDMETSSEIPFFASLSASYSTAFDTGHGLLRLGYNAKRFVFGPEGLIATEDGNETYRFGGFTTFRFALTPRVPAELTFNAGYQWVEDNSTGGIGSVSSGGEGAYGGVSLSLAF